MSDLCKKCGECCKHIKADFNSKLLLWDRKEPLTEEFASMLIPLEEGYYTCKFLKDNLCTNPNKPDICKKYPSYPFVELPESCDYRGEIFLKKERIMQSVRKLKEEILHYSILISTIHDKKEINQYKRIISAHQKYIDRYKLLGSDDW